MFYVPTKAGQIFADPSDGYVTTGDAINRTAVDHYWDADITRNGFL